MAYQYARTRSYILKGKYSMTTAEFDKMMDKQRGRCRICNDPIRGFDSKGMLRACVDHDHETGVNRALLCRHCNSGLGMFKDSVRNLAQAIVYLEEFGKTF